MKKHLLRNAMYCLAAGLVLAGCVATPTDRVMMEDPIKPLQMVADSQVVYWTDYVPLFVAEKMMPETAVVYATGEITNICLQEKRAEVDIPILPNKPVAHTLITCKQEKFKLLVRTLQPRKGVKLYAYAQNRKLPEEAITDNGDGTYSIDLKEVPRKIRKLDTWYLRVYGEDNEYLFNDILVPMHKMESITETKDLNRHMPHSQVLYSILVDRFHNGNPSNDWKMNNEEVLDIVDYQGGDFAGITEKIKAGYFDSLGVNTLWISPITQNPWDAWGMYPFKNGNKYDPSKTHTKFSGYHGYWPISITQLEQRFGTEEEFKELLATAHKHDINVILDYVANHMHINSPTFQTHPDWHTDSILPDGRRNFELWDEARLTTWFDVHIPTLDLERPEVCDPLTDSALYWLEKYELDGFRHDACKHIPECYWRMFGQKLVERFPGRPIWMIGETYGSPQLINTYVKSGMLNAQFDFNVYYTAMHAICHAGTTMKEVNTTILESLNTYGSHHTMGNITGNHDQIRFASLAGGGIGFDEGSGKEAGWTREVTRGDEELAFKRALLQEVLNLTIPGVPCIYQGDEYAEPGGNDPDNRHMMRFSNQLNDAEREYRQQVSELIAFRRHSMPLLYGEYIPVYADENLLVFDRIYMGQTLRVEIDSKNNQYSIYDPKETESVFYRGADVSWLTEQEADGVKFYDEDGKAQDCLTMLRGLGMNSIRLRVWVNHETGWCNKEDVVTKAQRAAMLGLKVMLNFHYSDNFADPAHQATPKAWESLEVEELKEALTNHTKEVLQAIKDAGVIPTWVQVGNETRCGMLWESGRLWSPEQGDLSYNWPNYAMYTRAGYEAVKEIFPNAQVIVHIDNAYEDNDWFFDKMQANGGKWDMIGLSHYPQITQWSHLTWKEMNRRAIANIKRLHEKYQCPVMMVEVGTESTRPEESALVMADLMELMKDSPCKGIFYWEPQVYNQWKPAEYAALGWGAYSQGAFTSEGKANESLQIMLKPKY